MNWQFSEDRNANQSAISSATLMVVAWTVLIIMTAAVFTTYARLPITELYHVSRSGLEGGASRSLTFLNYPGAFIAIVLIGFAAARLYVSSETLTRRVKIISGLIAPLALVLSLIAAVPGVVDQSNLDARPVNALPAIGVLLALVLSGISIRTARVPGSIPWNSLDTLRAVVTAIVVFLALPWILAEFGFYIGDVPLFGQLFMSREIPAGEALSAVHPGDHHGMSGTMYLLIALWLSRELWLVRPTVLRWMLAMYLSLMMVYGSFIAAQDFWLEQIVKRGWTSVEIPNLVQPALSPGWGLIVGLTLVLGSALVYYTRAGREQHESVAMSAESPGGTLDEPEPGSSSAQSLPGED
jgi:hypothetical protein